MLEPTFFENDISNHPLQWDGVNAMNWNEVRADEESSKTVYYDENIGWEVSKDYVTHVNSETETAGTKDFQKIVANLVYYWKQLRE